MEGVHINMLGSEKIEPLTDSMLNIVDLTLFWVWSMVLILHIGVCTVYSVLLIDAIMSFFMRYYICIAAMVTWNALPWLQKSALNNWSTSSTWVQFSVEANFRAGWKPPLLATYEIAAGHHPMVMVAVDLCDWVVRSYLEGSHGALNLGRGPVATGLGCYGAAL
jgi:hypothetical protein